MTRGYDPQIRTVIRGRGRGNRTGKAVNLSEVRRGRLFVAKFVYVRTPAVHDLLARASRRRLPPAEIVVPPNQVSCTTPLFGVRFRSRGGDNRRTKRLTVCAWHHLRAIHGGLVRSWGTAPHGIRWQLGIEDGSGLVPLLELLGNPYLANAEVRADRLIRQRSMATRLAAWIPLDGNWEALRRTRSDGARTHDATRLLAPAF